MCSHWSLVSKLQTDSVSTSTLWFICDIIFKTVRFKFNLLQMIVEARLLDQHHFIFLCWVLTINL